MCREPSNLKQLTAHKRSLCVGWQTAWSDSVLEDPASPCRRNSIRRFSLTPLSLLPALLSSLTAVSFEPFLDVFIMRLVCRYCPVTKAFSTSQRSDWVQNSISLFIYLDWVQNSISL